MQPINWMYSKANETRQIQSDTVVEKMPPIVSCLHAAVPLTHHKADSQQIRYIVRIARFELDQILSSHHNLTPI